MLSIDHPLQSVEGDQIQNHNFYLLLNKNLPVHKSFLQRLDGLKNNKEENGDKCFEFSKPVVFKDICFNYPGRKGVINNLNLKINPYKTVAFVGGSGAGKSTILDLILGLLKPDTGYIFYGDLHLELEIESRLAIRLVM